jgi:copper transport protein
VNDELAVASAWIDLVATTIFAGSLVFAATIADPSERGRRVRLVAFSVLVATLAVELGANTWRMHRVSGIGGLELVRDVVEMRWTSLWLGRVAGLLVLGTISRSTRRSGAATAALALAWLGLRSFQGHAGAHDVGAGFTDWIHLAAASTWLGGLVQLACFAHPTRDALLRMRRLATAAIAALLASGVYGALYHVHSVHVLTSSPYGRTLVAKVAIAAPILVLGAINHFRLVPRALDGSPDAERALARTVTVEIALGAVVLGASALLGSLPMPHF